MSNYKVAPHPADPTNRIVVIDGSGRVVGDTEKRGRTDQQVLDAFTQKSGGGKSGGTSLSQVVGPAVSGLLGIKGINPKTLGIIKTAQEITGVNPQKEATKDKTVDDIKNAFTLLGDIESKPGWKALPNQVIQELGRVMGMNSDLETYKQKTDILSGPIVKGVQGTSGAPSDWEQKKSERYLPQGMQIFSSDYRPGAIKNAFDSIKSQTGRDLAAEFSEEELRRMGYFPSGGNAVPFKQSPPQAGPSAQEVEAALKVLGQ